MDTYSEILEKEPYDLLMWLKENFTVDFPTKIETIEDMNYASSTILKLTSYHSYLCELLAYSKILCRQKKQEENKGDYIDKKNCIEAQLSKVKFQISAISRAVTIRSENNKELFMMNSFKDM